MLQDTAELAAKYLREAIPLMVKHDIPPTPFNYALWYNYVSNRDPMLNEAIENIIEAKGTYSPEKTEELFTQHIINDHIIASKDIQKSLKSIMAELQSQVDVTLKGTNDFHQLLSESSQNLNQTEVEPSGLSGIISGLIHGTERLSQTADTFRQQMAEAQKEVEQLKIELRKTRREAQSDSLTGLYNRRFLDEYLEEKVASAASENMYVVIADIDHFKSFNDNYGHQVGDQVIKRVASLLKRSLIGNEISARYGGEEFVLVLKETLVEGIEERAEKMRKSIETIVLKDRREGKSIRRITASFGIAKFSGAESATDWVERADKALYQAKKSGRNRVESAD